MRYISILAAFALTTVVCAVNPILLGEVHENRFRSRTPVDRKDNSANDGTSVETSASGGDQAPPSRKRKSTRSNEEAESTESGDDATSSHGQPNTGTRPKLRRQSGQVDLYHDSAGEKPAYSPAALKKSDSSSVSSQKSSLSLGTITLGSSDSWTTIFQKALTLDSWHY
jgi:hypothetical protein